LAVDYAGYVAAVEWHGVSGYPLYSVEARNKWRQYPPTAPGGGYYTPWAWIDGKSRGSSYGSWSGIVASRITVPTSVSMTVVGEYDPGTRNGSLQVVIYNGDTLALQNAALQVAVTEDSLNYTGPNGDPWHNHVLRDYIPDQNGTALNIPAGGYDTIDVNFTLQTGWVERMCDLVLYVQSSVTLADSSRPVYQGYTAPVQQFTGIETPAVPTAFYRNITAAVGPNPVRSAATFRIAGPDAEPFTLGIYTPDGRLVRELSGTLAVTGSQVRWDRRDTDGRRVARGAYVYRVSAADAACSGKLVLAD
jgi:hypothetical protein